MNIKQKTIGILMILFLLGGFAALPALGRSYRRQQRQNRATH